jgi:hypothetical protein
MNARFPKKMMISHRSLCTKYFISHRKRLFLLVENEIKKAQQIAKAKLNISSL